jgi:thiol-disulfide isomerase/thioredoxin
MLVMVMVTIFSLPIASAAFADTFPDFNSRTFGGESITQSVFGGKKLTMVNMWATWCPPCVAEMPELASLGRSMPEGAQLVGIILDVTTEDESEKGEADRILKRAGADFTQILYDKSMDGYRSTVEYIPTTIFVDSNGNILGESMVGADSEENYRKAIEKILQQL